MRVAFTLSPLLGVLLGLYVLREPPPRDSSSLATLALVPSSSKAHQAAPGWPTVSREEIAVPLRWEWLPFDTLLSTDEVSLPRGYATDHTRTSRRTPHWQLTDGWRRWKVSSENSQAPCSHKAKGLGWQCGNITVRADLLDIAGELGMGVRIEFLGGPEGAVTLRAEPATSNPIRVVIARTMGPAGSVLRLKLSRGEAQAVVVCDSPPCMIDLPARTGTAFLLNARPQGKAVWALTAWGK